ncbi:MAG: hypothetical protein H6819_01060 [Phycisphaerales bacterium]|nr:hypothetical protein [Phycisphaerales bacterium]MCB9857203.1 hypothetical protein [Phycisphaerales bacterium]MCB9863084.1 hypothetical protein [Phycisphaerales bacterium]
MPTDYQVHMWLSYSPTDLEAKEAFELRFPASLKNAWESLSISATNLSDLANKLNDEILSNCKSYINSDTGLSVTAIVAFTAAGWSEVSASHSTPTPMNIDVTAPQSVPWTFSYNGKSYQMTASCTFPA